MIVPVYDIGRECQYCEDLPTGPRIRCNRRATTWSVVRIAGKREADVSFRCPAHRGKLNDTTLMTRFFDTIDTNHTFVLGYETETGNLTNF